MAKLFFILIFCFFWTFPAWSQTCSEIGNMPEIEISTSYGKLTYNHSLSTPQITAIASRYGMAESGLFAYGLSTVEMNMDVELNTIGKFTAANRLCVVPSKINIFIGYSDPVIYLSKVLAKDSCEYNVVLRHEQTHQQINKTALDYFIPLFQQAIYKIAASIPPVEVARISDVDRASKELTAIYNKKLTPLFEVFKQELLTEQGKLDNMNNYEYENRLCR